MDIVGNAVQTRPDADCGRIAETARAHLFDTLLLLSAPFVLIQSEHLKLQLPLFALASWRLWAKRKKLPEIGAALPALVLVLLLAGISFLWSDARMESFEHLLYFYGATAIGLFFALTFDLRHFIEKFGVSMGLVAILSFVLVLVVPSVGIDPEDSLWRGYFNYKTNLGLGIGLTIIALAFFRPKTSSRKLLLACVAVVCFALLVGSYSITAVVALLGALVLIVLLLFVRRNPSWTRPIVIAAVMSIPCVLVILGNLDTIVAIFGKDATFTGRTSIWRNVTDAISDRPILGYGFGAFWVEGGAWEQYIPLCPDCFTPKAAHDGYLEVMVNIGIVGEVLLLLFLATAVRRTGQLFWRGQDLISAWPLCIVVNEIITNLSEATFLCTRYVNTLDWAITVAAVVFAVQKTAVPDPGSSRIRGNGPYQPPARPESILSGN